MFVFDDYINLCEIANICFALFAYMMNCVDFPSSPKLFHLAFPVDKTFKCWCLQTLSILSILKFEYIMMDFSFFLINMWLNTLY